VTARLGQMVTLSPRRRLAERRDNHYAYRDPKPQASEAPRLAQTAYRGTQASTMIDGRSGLVFLMLICFLCKCRRLTSS
jgi:hypothetical protein